MADSDIKAMTANLDGVKFEETAFTVPVPLNEAKVAIVTSASLHHPDDEDFSPMDTGYRILRSEARDYVMGHWSPNFDATGFALDINTVFPIDRLDELAAQGIIGSVAEEHLAYAGNQFDLSAIWLDSGPSGAKFLKEQDVDVVILTPV
ncbi:MAG: glycine/sarcosine/betaine reductase selenoprotein B family protein [Actinomycetota bacterium]|nr:glycine/sarcosine/betaine reductase selenoprotein B family protein [Actinomycetota bacterium]